MCPTGADGVHSDTSKKRIRLYLLCDEQTDSLYAEMGIAEQDVDILGFLTRAWSTKPWHYFHGCPGRISISKSLLKDTNINRDMNKICKELSIDLFDPEFPPWYAHLVKRFESAIDGIYYRINYSSINCGDLKWNISELDNIASLACLDAALPERALWQQVVSRYPRMPLPDVWLNYVDSQYNPRGSWRHKLNSDWPELNSVLKES